MRKIEGASFRADRAWAGENLAFIERAIVKLRWTDAPFRWHENATDEIFLVLGGEVDMHTRAPDGSEQIITLRAGDLLQIRAGESHVAHPRGGASLLVIEGQEP